MGTTIKPSKLTTTRGRRLVSTRRAVLQQCYKFGLRDWNKHRMFLSFQLGDKKPFLDVWYDVDIGQGFHEVGYLPANDNVRYTISEPARIEILKRLSALNRQRWEEEEKAGLHKKGKRG